ncbi:hypothetical protein AC578_3680 [Pseudocercospora eumusae]|uniref:G-protein coupled receptors family 1 profile domain-containing protein n=1 Tax=Pseudocercospora eumusae TaxID=321146 RepID=A0A139HT33_9PEZI|nr:hypothetical protein AC578_3680 [Pseudocercospora eumusae]
MMMLMSDTNPVRTQFLLSGDISSLLVSQISLPALAVFFWQRHPHRDREGRRTVATCLCLLCYATTFLYIFAVTILAHVRIPASDNLCNGMMITCLLLHNTSKAVEFAFLIERAYIISWPNNSRFHTPEYVLCTLFIMLPYVAVTGLAIQFRIAYLFSDEPDTVCIIGIKRFAIVPMLCVETLAELFLTLRFLFPLLLVHRRGKGLLPPLRKVVIRTSVGAAITLLLDVAVKVSLTLFNGEPTWLCYLACKVEAFLAACVLHWVTKPVLSKAERRSGQLELGVGFEDFAAIMTPSALDATTSHG